DVRAVHAGTSVMSMRAYATEQSRDGRNRTGLVRTPAGGRPAGDDAESASVRCVPAWRCDVTRLPGRAAVASVGQQLRTTKRTRGDSEGEAMMLAWLISIRCKYCGR